ncbi:MAG: non-ribosomal peptide synthetase [Sediminibacterium sp.]
MMKKSIVNGDDNPKFIQDITLAAIFAETCRVHPQKTALVFGPSSLSYQALDQKSTEVAAFLFARGIGPGALVGVWLNRGLDLHSCILGIIKSGAAYVPFDKEMPLERVFNVLTEIGANACLLEEPEAAGSFPLFSPVTVFKEAALLKDKLHERPSPDNIAYIIYTSGSTGKPKGIPISHQQISHLLLAENSILGICSEDVVYQGFSVSFDMWLEETWISYLVGATLVVSDAITAKSFDSLHLFLNEHSVTVLHAVPSLLAIMNREIPTLRIVNSGGEACTETVQKKWCPLDLVFYNSYGPTETTVTASLSRLGINDPITIGYPLPNYGMAVVDASMNPVAWGEKGELVISGPGVSGGYMNRPELTAQKFLPKPVTLEEMPGNRIYLSGDTAFMDEAGRIHVAGRMDDQVKLRGYRIELGEIEAALNHLEGINQCAVVLKKLNGVESLVAYVLVEENTFMQGSELDEQALRKQLAVGLPAYMIPSQFIPLKEFPRLPSGKVNKKSLPEPVVIANRQASGIPLPIDAGDTIEQKAMVVLSKLFPDEVIDPGKDFFDDLGGHSLLAALFVSELREKAGVEEVSIRDVYTHRPISNVISFWESVQNRSQNKQEDDFKKVTNISFYSCWLAQSAALVFIYALLAAQIFVPYLGYYYLQQQTGTHLVPILFALLMFCVMPVLQTVLSITLKWLIIGRMKEGDYPLWGVYYFRWWITRRLLDMVQVEVISGTPLFNNYLNLLGAKVAKDAQLSNFSFSAADLLSIGPNVTISANVVLNNAYVEGGYLKLRRIEILENGYVGTSSVVNGNCRIEAGGELSDLSALGKDERIEADCIWTGSPARFTVKREASTIKYHDNVGDKRRRKYKLVFLLLIFVFPFAILLPLLPTIITINELDDNAADYDFTYLLLMPVLSFVYIAVFMLLVVLLSRLLQRKVRPGKFPLYSPFYVKKWLADQLLSLSLTVLHPIYASIYVSWFFKLLGAKVGKNTEISTASNVTHQLFSIGDESFIADAVSLGESDVRNQEIILADTSIGNKTFVGNSALVPQGYQLGNDMLVGVLSVPPTAEQEQAVPTRDWLGSPAIALPKRQGSIAFPARLTFAPSFSRKLARGTIEFLRIIFPQTAILCLSILFIAYGHDLITDYSIGGIILLFPFYYLAIVAIPAYFITVILKWVIVGKYRETQLPMWTWKVWRSEAITTIYEALSVPFLLDYLRGTPWLPVLLRLLGVKTGSKVWMDSTDITEYDMVSIGSYTEINFESGPQTHLFEDRIMKIGPVSIGEKCTIGCRSIILYNTHIGNDTTLEPLSLVMKGESLPPDTRWAGSPVKKV